MLAVMLSFWAGPAGAGDHMTPNASFIMAQSQPAQPTRQNRFDESRAFKRDIAARFTSMPNLVTTMLLAIGAQEAVPGTQTGPGMVDAFCGCSFDRGGRLTQPTVCAAMRGIDDEAQARMDHVRLVDVEAIARNLACFREGSNRCVRDGLRLGGVRCCEMSDKDFVSALKDPALYLLAPKPLADRLRGLVPGRASPGSPEMCGVAIDADRGVYSVPPRLNGALARAALLSSERYGAELPLPVIDLMALAQATPPTRGEIAIERLVRSRYGVAARIMDRYLATVPLSDEQKRIGLR
ncbi:MAG: hypothetical protein K2X45_02050 [Phreatobacter sp.]|nr:hypothetical protein [Phreatobacter sp.]